VLKFCVSSPAPLVVPDVLLPFAPIPVPVLLALPVLPFAVVLGSWLPGTPGATLLVVIMGQFSSDLNV
jgi:hypothetical protein